MKKNAENEDKDVREALERSIEGFINPPYAEGKVVAFTTLETPRIIKPNV